MYFKQKTKNPCLSYPNVPDTADFRDEMKPFIDREILRARIAEAQHWGTFPRVLELQKELELVNAEIAKKP